MGLSSAAPSGVMARTVTEVIPATLGLQTLLREAYIRCHCPHGAAAQQIMYKHNDQQIHLYAAGIAQVSSSATQVHPLRRPHIPECPLQVSFFWLMQILTPMFACADF